MDDEKWFINLESQSKFSFIGSVAFIVGAVIVLVGFYFTINHYRSNVYLAQAQKATDAEEAIDTISPIVLASIKGGKYNSNQQGTKRLAEKRIYCFI